MVMEEVILTDAQKKRIIGEYKPRAWRLLNAKQLTSQYVVKVLDEEEAFVVSYTLLRLMGCSLPQKFKEANEDII